MPDETQHGTAPPDGQQPAGPRPFGGDDGTPPPPAVRPYATSQDGAPAFNEQPALGEQPAPEGQPPSPQPPYGQPAPGQPPRGQPPWGYGPPPDQPAYPPVQYPPAPYGQPPYSPPPPPPASPETIAAVRRLNRRALMYAVSGFALGFLLLGLGVYFVPLALVVDIGALVLATRARRAAREAGQSDAGGIIAIITASLGVAFVIAVLGMVAVFWNELHDYNECMAGANTVQARETCQQDLSDAIMRRLGV